MLCHHGRLLFISNIIKGVNTCDKFNGLDYILRIIITVFDNIKYVYFIIIYIISVRKTI
jgi:hypothetical protein